MTADERIPIRPRQRGTILRGIGCLLVVLGGCNADRTGRGGASPRLSDVPDVFDLGPSDADSDSEGGADGSVPDARDDASPEDVADVSDAREDVADVAPEDVDDFEGECADDNDNDADGLTDCADPDCQLSPLCPPPEAGPWASVVAGGHHTCGVRVDGEVRCWGMNVFGEIGAPPESDLQWAVVEGIRRPRSLGLGFLHSCGVDGSGRVLCWGANAGGFHNYGSDRTTTAVVATPFDDRQADATAIAAGEQHACVILSDRTVECWGMNSWGQLGDGRSQGTPQNVRTSVTGVAEVVQIGVGFGHTCALDEVGGVSCWGANGLGELGDGTTEISHLPLWVAGTGEVVSLGVGAHHSCVANRVGEVWCWGWGDRPFTESVPDRPRLISGVSNAVEVVAGGAFSCARSSDGTVQCWGHERSDFPRTPVRIFESALSVSAGSGHICSLLEGGEVECAGLGANGQTTVPD